MAYAAITKPSSYMNTKLYTGNATDDTAITGVGFQPDWTWIKTRGSVKNHAIFDAVRTATKYIQSNTTAIEGTDATSLKSFDSDGFTLGVGSTLSVVNQDTIDMASWNWKANGSGSANAVGDIASTVSVNTTSGFSIVKYVGSGNNDDTVGHGLGVAPKMIIFKNLDTVVGWVVGHDSIGWNKIMFLNTTVAEATDSNAFNNTAPSSTVFTLGPNAGTGTNETGSNIVAYCFADVKGYSKFGSYVGNANADGTFIYTGFKPSFVVCKKSSGVEDWGMWGYYPDYNVLDRFIYANGDSAEYVGILPGDMVSNGFKIRTSDGKFNGSGATYIYMAFASEPLVANVGSGLPATAR